MKNVNYQNMTITINKNVVLYALLILFALYSTIDLMFISESEDFKFRLVLVTEIFFYAATLGFIATCIGVAVVSSVIFVLVKLHKAYSNWNPEYTFTINFKKDKHENHTARTDDVSND